MTSRYWAAGRPRWAGMMVIIVGLGCAVMLLSRGFLFYIGSEHFVDAIERGWLAVEPMRSATSIFLIPVALLAQVSDDLVSLSYAFGLIYCLVPLISVAAVLRIMRDRPTPPILLAVMAICLLGLQGQLNITSQKLIAMQLYWVLLAGVVCQCRTWLLATLILGLFFLHPVVGAYFVATGLSLLVLAPRDRSCVKRLRTAGVSLLAVGLLRCALVWVEPSERARALNPEFLGYRKLWWSFAQPVAGYVVLFLLCLLVTALVWAWVRPRARQTRTPRRWSGARCVFPDAIFCIRSQSVAQRRRLRILAGDRHVATARALFVGQPAARRASCRVGQFDERFLRRVYCTDVSGGYLVRLLEIQHRPDAGATGG